MQQTAVRHLVIILGDQLNEDNPALADFDAQQDQVLMVEAIEEATHVWSHKARIALFLSGMRHFAHTLQAKGITPIYLTLRSHAFTSLESAWAAYIAQLTPQKVVVCETGDYRIEQTLVNLCANLKVPLAIRDDTHFLCSRADFKHWAQGRKELRMEFFYREMRKKYQVLMEGNNPLGGAWNYDADNRKPFAKTGPQHLPAAPKVTLDSISQQVLADVEKYFPQHPGSLQHFIWPVTREQALVFLQDFITYKLPQFGDHQDAMWASTEHSPYLWHSLLSTSLNLKLIHPREVIQAAVLAHQENRATLASVEGFIRQILGWREFIRGVYWLDMPDMAKANHYNHQRDLPQWYWTGETHMHCMRHTIQQTMQLGYAHHIQRLMVTGMFGILAEISPSQVADWYLAVYVDAVDWVELPNVAGMALFANGGRFTSKPYIASGAYIKRMSNYCQSCQYKPDIKTGPQACPITTLYWHFLIKHYQSFASHPRTSLMVKHVDNMTEETKSAITVFAQQRLATLNTL